jgi:2-C-methyl-D-erythritol 2,4-cyclodiphosphate synthase
MQFRIGSGIDSHKLEKDIPLIIGGVLIPFEKGSKGHSDGDVLFHAIVDAVLGALALGDIGDYFPSENSKWKDADSKLFMEDVCKLIEEKGYSIENVDITIILQKPVLKKYIMNMRNNTAFVLSVDLDQISIKATTTDKLGFIGKGEGIAAMASILLKK